MRIRQPGMHRGKSHFSTETDEQKYKTHLQANRIKLGCHRIERAESNGNMEVSIVH